MDRSSAPLQACVDHFVESLVKEGLKHVVISPGSRNAPLIIACSKLPNIEIISVTDERSAGFIALGIAQQSGAPAAVICTSGSAMTSYFPAVLEAYYSRIPLLILSADRPPELIGQWDGQCIRQEGLYGDQVRASFSTPSDYNDPESFALTGSEAIHATHNTIPGPVHVNIPLREPLYGSGELQYNHIEDGVSRVSAELDGETTGDFDKLLDSIKTSKKILIVDGARESFSASLSKRISESLKIETGAFHFGDIISYSRTAKDVGTDVLFNSKDDLSDLRPELLITTGTSVVSKGLKQFLRENKPDSHWHISAFEEIGDPFNSLTDTLNRPTKSQLDQIIQAIELTDNSYREQWQSKAKTAVENLTRVENLLFHEFSALRKVCSELPGNSILQVSNSMPVRTVSMHSDTCHC